MTIARQFYLLVCVPPLLALGFAVALMWQSARLSAEGAQLLNNVNRTGMISQRLARGNAEQGELLNRQLQSLDPRFPDRLRRISFELGEQCTEYLRLDIGREERLTVEKIKTLQSELALVASRVYRDLATGADRKAAVEMSRAHLLEGQVRDEFETLGALQLSTLQSVMTHLRRTARRGMVGVLVLVGGVLLAAWATAIVVRRRILAPVRAILLTSEKIRLGDLAARAPEGYRDEIGRLTQGFNYMAESLGHVHAGLERKVEERTAELRAIQGRLLQTEKLSAVGLLVGGVAHELNNPLTGIVGFNQLARMELAGRPDAAGPLKLLDQVDAQVERCRRIVQNLLQFARKQEPRREAFELNAAIEQMLQLRAYELATRNTTLVREFDAANPVVWADRDKVQQVLLNLLNNAADAVAGMATPGTILVRTKAAGDEVLIEFLDNGPGFEKPERAFDPFYTTKEVGKGTGLGLSVCYGIVREHGGRIEVANLDRGARVSITLSRATSPLDAPATGPTLGAGQPEAPAPAPGPPRRALVVDDEESLLRLQAAFLRKMGIDAQGVTSGEEAIRRLESEDVDLIISDVRMPGVSGVELYDWVRANRPRLVPRFLLTSGDLVGLNLEEFFRATGIARIDKPFRYEAYAEAVRRILEEERLPR